MLRCAITPQLEMRLLEMRYAGELYQLIMMNKAYLSPWMSWAAHVESMDAIHRFLSVTLNQFAQGQGVQWGIFYNGQLKGAIGYAYPIDWTNRSGVIGYWIDQQCQGQGWTTLALQATLKHAFETLELNRIELRCQAQNLPSKRVAQKAGFQHEATMQARYWCQGQLHAVEVYGLLKSEFKTTPGLNVC